METTMMNTLKTTKEGVMKAFTVSAARTGGRVSRAAATPASQGVQGSGAAAELDAQESFVQELLATFSDRWEW
jgi:hypothetical protein